MRIAALCDIHGNLPALEAVLAEVRAAEAEHIVVGGDVLPGPMPRQTLDLLLGFDVPVHFIVGNGELAVLAQIDAVTADGVTYWGTTSGKPLPESQRRVLRWTADEIHPQYDAALRSWPKTLRLEVDGLGQALFCHGTPRSETEVFTRLTPEGLLEADLQIIAKVRAGLRPPRPPPLPSPEDAEDVPEAEVPEEVLEGGGAEAGEVLGTEGRMAELVVLGLLLGVREDLEGLVDLLELLLGLLVPGVQVGVVLPGELPEGLLDILVRGIPGNPQDLVVVPLCHAGRPGEPPANPPLP